MSQSNGDALNEIKNQTKQIFHNKIEKSTPLLKEIPPPTVPPPHQPFIQQPVFPQQRWNVQ